MTSVMQERSAGEFPTTRIDLPDRAGYIALEPQNTDTPRAALDEALRVNLSVAYYGKVDLDPRMYSIIRLKKLALSADEFGKIAERPDCDDETRTKASAMSQALSTSFESSVSEIDRFKVILTPETGVFTNSDTSADIKNYQNTKAISAALLNEQLPAHEHVYPNPTTDTNGNHVFMRDEDVIRGAMTSIDTDLIIKITEQRAKYSHAHTLDSPRERGQAFVDILEQLSQAQLNINMHGNLPVANAVTRLISAQALHDLALLGEFDTKQNRDLAVNAAATDLWDAKEALASAKSKNDVTNGVYQIITEYLEKYSREIGIDPTVNPTEKDFEITDEEIAELVAKLGAAAHSAAHYHD